MLRSSFVKICKLVQAKKIFEGFLPDDIWAWWPFWSCDPDALSKLLFPISKEAPHKIWF